MATTGLLITLFNLLATSTLLITVPSSTAAPVELQGSGSGASIDDYFKYNVLEALRVVHYDGVRLTTEHIGLVATVELL